MYNLKNTELVWRGLTLSNFASSKVKIIQKGNSFNTVSGIFGETMSFPNTQRYWNIISTFLPNSSSYKILEEDALYRTTGTLIIRDLNTGSCDIFSDCFVNLLENKQDDKDRTVVWFATKRNSK